MDEKQHTVKYFIVSKSKLSFFILDSSEVGLVRGMYLKLKTSFWSKNSYIPELILNYIWFKTKYKSHMNIWAAINSKNEKLKDQLEPFKHYYC